MEHPFHEFIILDELNIPLKRFSLLSRISNFCLLTFFYRISNSFFHEKREQNSSILNVHLVTKSIAMLSKDELKLFVT